MAEAELDLVVVGAATRDLDPTDPRGWRLGGTVSYASLAAARLGIHVKALIGIDSETEQASELDALRAAGVEVRLVRLENAPVFDNRMTPTGRVQHALGASDQISIGALPAGWRSPAAAILGPVAAELGVEWADAFPRQTFVGLAVQGLIRRLVPGQPVQRLPLTASPLMERADAILVSAEDVVGETPPLRALLRTGQKLVVTHGERGAVLLERAGTTLKGRLIPATPRRHPVDTTGAGDVFLAAWVAAHAMLGETEEWRALLVASVTASLSVERATFAELPTKREVGEVIIKLRGQVPG
jgi:ribokinase